MIDQTAHNRINAMEKILDSHATKLEQVEVNIKRQTSAIEENTRITKNTETMMKNTDANTAELVQLFKGVKSVRQLILFYAPFAALLAAIGSGVLWVYHNFQKLLP